jgi:hypothetical protein
MSLAGVVHDLTAMQDASRVLVNPHKGWYHHYPDNHIKKYEIAKDSDLVEFPGMDHVYLRLAWGYLEPKEGQFDWPVIDRIIDKWTARGLGIAFRISCRETSSDRIEQQFATPRWVMEAGAKGGHYLMGKATGPEGPWEPAYDDPIFLAKLDRFLEAFAARYDGKPWVRYIDIGSIGDWGEGHAWGGSRKECGLAVRKQHVDLHLKHFKRSGRSTNTCSPRASAIAMTASSWRATSRAPATPSRSAAPSFSPRPTRTPQPFSNWNTTVP